MSARDILDKDGNIVGALVMPDDTTEDVWTAKLAEYAATPTIVPTLERVKNSIAAAIAFGQKLTIEFAAENILLGITQAGKTGDCIRYLSGAASSMSTGSLYDAITTIDSYIADTSDAKAALTPFVTNDRLTTYKNKIQDYLGIART